MRMTIAVLTVLTLGLLVAPASPAAPAPTDRPTAGVDQPERVARASLRERVVAITNRRRAAASDCRKLRSVRPLNRAAQKHTRRMANWDRDGRLDHRLPGEPSLGTRIDNAGYRWIRIGENIAAGMATPRGVVRAWMASPGHRRNILDCRFRDIGVGYAVAEDGTPYWTQDFGKR